MSDRTDKTLLIPRRICTGMIVSTEYVQRVLPMWRSDLLDVKLAQIVCGWCMEFYNKYQRAPKEEIEVWFEERREQLDYDTAEQIELMLRSLSDEYARGDDCFNVDYLLDQTRQYFQHQHIQRHNEEVAARLERGEVDKAQAEITSFTPVVKDTTTYVDLFSSSATAAFKSAFKARMKPILNYPSALGELWNAEMTRDSFVVLVAPEKTGKSWFLMDAAIRGARQGYNVAFFQAGDMSEAQMLRRVGVYVSRRSDQERYCKDIWEPMLDCRLHQRDKCNKSVRETPDRDIALDSEEEAGQLQGLKDAYKRCPKHTPCYNCTDIQGAVWLKPMAEPSPLAGEEIERELETFKRQVRGRLRMSTYANETLTVETIGALLDQWEREDGFVVDIIVLDYADILAAEEDIKRLDFRQQTNRIWQRLRRLSQKRHCLLISATQAKAKSYKKELIDMTDFSEDKRKWAHVTAAFGLNQTPEEKRIGILRINTIVSRDSDYSTDKPVSVLQRLQIGRPVLSSFWTLPSWHKKED